MLPNRHGSSGSDNYRYGFNGKENDLELKGDGNSYDFGARMYDSRIGRWFAPDPLEKEFSYVSTYVYALNNPLNVIDSDGNKPYPVFERYIQTAINRLPKIAAINQYNTLAFSAYGNNDGYEIDGSRYETKLPYNGKYLKPKSGVDYIVGTSELNFYGYSANVSYDAIKKLHMGLYTIKSKDFKIGTEDHPHSYTSFGSAAGGIGATKTGSFLELDYGNGDKNHFAVRIQFKDYFEAKIVYDAYENEYKRELNKLVAKDAVVNKYVKLLKFGDNLYELRMSVYHNPNNKKLQNKLEKWEKAYEKSSKDFVKFRDKVLKKDGKKAKSVYE